MTIRENKGGVNKNYTNLLNNIKFSNGKKEIFIIEGQFFLCFKDPNAIQMKNFLDQLMPPESKSGQSQLSETYDLILEKHTIYHQETTTNQEKEQILSEIKTLISILLLTLCPSLYFQPQYVENSHKSKTLKTVKMDQNKGQKENSNLNKSTVLNNTIKNNKIETGLSTHQIEAQNNKDLKQNNNIKAKEKYDKRRAVKRES